MSISCIIPVFKLREAGNRGKFLYLLKSIKAARERLGGAEFELIVVSDDEDDGVDSILGPIEEARLSRETRFFRNPRNLGQAYSRNYGAAQSSFDYLHFIDQDDSISVNFYEEWEKQEGKDLYICDAFFLMDETSSVVHALTPLCECVYRRTRTVERLWPLLVSNIAYSPGQAIIRREAFSSAGGFAQLEHRGSDDYGLFYRMCMSGSYSFRFLGDARFYYRIHSLQNSKSLDMDKSVEEFFRDSQPTRPKEKVVRAFKLSSALRPFAVLAYITLFKRATT